MLRPQWWWWRRRITIKSTLTLRCMHNIDLHLTCQPAAIALQYTTNRTRTHTHILWFSFIKPGMKWRCTKNSDDSEHALSSTFQMRATYCRERVHENSTHKYTQNETDKEEPVNKNVTQKTVTGWSSWLLWNRFFCCCYIGADAVRSFEWPTKFLIIITTILMMNEWKLVSFLRIGEWAEETSQHEKRMGWWMNKRPNEMKRTENDDGDDKSIKKVHYWFDCRSFSLSRRA